MNKLKTDVTFIERNGRTLSKRTKFFENGRVAEIGIFGHSQSDWSWSIPMGSIKRYYESGQLESEVTYSELGIREGEWVFYNRDGKLIRKLIYNKDKLVEEIAFEGEETD